MRQRNTDPAIWGRFVGFSHGADCVPGCESGRDNDRQVGEVVLGLMSQYPAASSSSEHPARDSSELCPAATLARVALAPTNPSVLRCTRGR